MIVSPSSTCSSSISYTDRTSTKASMMVHQPVHVTFAILSVFLGLVFAETTLKSTNSDHPFPVTIGAVSHMVQGRISEASEPGTLIPTSVVQEGMEDADYSQHLRVEVKRSVYKRPFIHLPEETNSSDPDATHRDKHPVITFANQSLPYGMEYVIIHTNAFIINKDRYIVVNDFSALDDKNRIHFDVILKDKLGETKYVSNQLPFVVEVEYAKVTPNPDTALFAGVLILTIVAISLIIPFVVRSKRRHKAGKPICGCGSADDGSDNDSTAQLAATSTSASTSRKAKAQLAVTSLSAKPHSSSRPRKAEEFGPDYKHRGLALNGKDNLAMMLDSGRHLHRPSVDQHTTIQNHVMRSTSSMHFQPHYLDPHYRDIYDRPDFSNVRTLPFIPQQPSTYYNDLELARQHPGLTSNRSSISSIYNYPANFNQNLVNKNGVPMKDSTDSPTDRPDIVRNGKPLIMSTPAVAVNGVKVADGRQVEPNGAVGGSVDAEIVMDARL